jgi:hypothetical protein
MSLIAEKTFVTNLEHILLEVRICEVHQPQVVSLELVQSLQCILLFSQLYQLLIVGFQVQHHSWKEREKRDFISVGALKTGYPCIQALSQNKE